MEPLSKRSPLFLPGYPGKSSRRDYLGSPILGGEPYYNYYTPHRYPCGCVATAMAQLMRFHEYPREGIETKTFKIFVDEVSEDRTTLGGNSAGGPYHWEAMALQPDHHLITDFQRKALGSLTYDAGLSVNMFYTEESSGTNTLMAAQALVETFGYTNAVSGFQDGENLSTTFRDKAVLPNLDAGYPVLFGITGPKGGHAIV